MLLNILDKFMNWSQVSEPGVHLFGVLIQLCYCFYMMVLEKSGKGLRENLKAKNMY